MHLGPGLCLGPTGWAYSALPDPIDGLIEGCFVARAWSQTPNPSKSLATALCVLYAPACILYRDVILFVECCEYSKQQMAFTVGTLLDLVR